MKTYIMEITNGKYVYHMKIKAPDERTALLFMEQALAIKGDNYDKIEVVQ